MVICNDADQIKPFSTSSFTEIHLEAWEVVGWTDWIPLYALVLVMHLAKRIKKNENSRISVNRPFQFCFYEYRA